MDIAIPTLAALTLGAIHALEPGHGKTFVTSYLLTGRSDRMQLLIMGLSMAISHTFVLMILGMLFLFVSVQKAAILQEALLIGSPVLVMAIGLYMVIKCHRKKSSCGCASHGCSKHQKDEAEKISTRTALFVGFTGGLLPCPSAMAVFSLSGTSGDPGDAFCLMLLYVAGFVLVMAILMILASFVKNDLISRFFKKNKTNMLQKISAYAILLTGMLYLTHNLIDHI